MHQLGTAQVEKGQYFLALDISEDSSQFNAGQPRLVVQENGQYAYVEGRTNRASSLSYVAFVVALYLFIHAGLERRRKKQAQFARDLSFTGLGPQLGTIQWESSPAVAPAAPPLQASGTGRPTLALAAIFSIAAAAGLQTFQLIDPGIVPLLVWMSALGAGAGASLLVIAANRPKQSVPVPVSLGQPGPGAWRGFPRRPSRPSPFSGLPSFGLMATNLYVFFVIIMATSQAIDKVGSTGLRVRLLRPDVTAQSIPGIQPILVWMRLTAGNRRPELFVNSRPVSWDDFDATLQAEINRRPPDWPVYLEGDRESDWQWVEAAIDRIRGLHAQVILLTHSHAGQGQ